MQITLKLSQLLTSIRKSVVFKREYLLIFVIFLFMRIVISGIGAVTVLPRDISPPPWLDLTQPGYPGLVKTVIDSWPASRLLITNWYRWDTSWFVKIALSGYSVSDGSISFMPFYPMLIRMGLYFTGGNALVSALIISNIFCVIALILFYEVALLELGAQKLAWQAFLFLITFPSTFFLFIGYSESIFLTLVLAIWLLIRKGHWHSAAFLSSLAVLTRLQGLALVVPMGWQALTTLATPVSLEPIQEFRTVISFLTHKHGWRRLLTEWRNPTWVAALFPLIAMGIYTVAVKYIGMNSVLNAYSYRYSALTFPWQGFWEFVVRIFTIKYLPADYVDLVLFVLLIGVTIYGFKRIRPALSLYTIALLIMVFSRSYGPTLLSGFNRFVLTTFPFFLSLSLLKLNDRLKFLIVAIFWVTQLLMVWNFISWMWVA
jgi:Gpi18-like mannosyltransferase